MAYETAVNAGGVDTDVQVVVGLFKDANDAHQAVAQLRAQGFTSNQIGAAFRTGSLDSFDRSRVDAVSTSSGNREESWWDKVKDAFRGDETATEREAHSIAGESTLSPKVYSRGEYEYDYADNYFEGSLAGAGIPADRAAYLTRSLEPGGAIVTVRDAARATEAEQILSANNGRVRYEEVTNASLSQVDDPTLATAASTGREISDTDYADRRPVGGVATGNADRLQLFGEVLRIHKDRVSRGEARVRKDVVTENQTIEVPVTREELVLERVAVSGDAPVPAANLGSDQEIRVPLTEEKVRLEKQAVVREEVLVGKREVTDVATVGDKVSHEELRVDSDLETPKRGVAGEELPGDVRRHG